MEREILTAALAPGPDCLSAEQLGRYADGAIPAEDQAVAARHIRGCLNCQAELALRQAVTSGTPRPGEAEVVRDGEARLEQRAGEIFGESPLGVAPLAAAAVLLLVVAGSFFLRTGKAPELPSGVTGEEVTRSLAVTVRGPVGDQVEAPRRFEWLAVERAVRYRVRLMEVDRREVWSTSTSVVGLDVPPAVRASWAPPRTLLWDVTAYDASGAAIADSGAQSFRLVLR